MARLWLDLDGVLADLGRAYREEFGLDASKELDAIDWDLVADSADFYARLPPTPDAHLLWSGVRHLRPAVLTGIPPRVEEAQRNKRDWVARHLGGDVEVVCCRSSEKWQHCGPGDVLVDDWEKYMRRWKRAGGLWVTHRSAEESLAALRSLGVL